MESDAILEVSNPVFISLFGLEMLFKVYALGIKLYLRSSFNMLDMMIILLSLAEFLPFTPEVGISVFRCARLLRIFKVTRYANIRPIYSFFIFPGFFTYYFYFTYFSYEKLLERIAKSGVHIGRFV